LALHSPPHITLDGEVHFATHCPEARWRYPSRVFYVPSPLAAGSEWSQTLPKVLGALSLYLPPQCWNVGRHRNSANAGSAGMSRQHHAHLPTPSDLPANVQHRPHPPSQPPYLMPTPLQPPFPTTGCSKSPACKRGVLSPCQSVTLMAEGPSQVSSP
jgi:hypothetical protein